MVNQYLIAQKLLATSAHLSRRPPSHHLKPYLSGTRNSLSILDLDKTTIALRSALTFLSTLISSGGKAFFLSTTSDLRDDVLRHMADRLGCSHDSQMGIPGFSTNAPGLRHNASKKIKIRVTEGGKPDCYVVLGMESRERVMAVVKEADRCQIPTVCVVDSGMPLSCFRRITYPVPAVDTTRFLYLFCNLLTKRVMVERATAAAVKA